MLHGTFVDVTSQIMLCKYGETHLTDELTNTRKLDVCLELKQIINYSKKNLKAFEPLTVV